jgi:hypothetical protein
VAAVTAAEAIAVADLKEAEHLAAEFEALSGGALTMALAQEVEPGDPLRLRSVSEVARLVTRKYWRSARTLQPMRLR